MIKTFRPNLILLFAILLFRLVIAQTELFSPDSASRVDLWHISDNARLYVGASFYYQNPNDSIIVTMDTSDADTSGTLFIMVPGTKDSSLALFTNRQHSARFNVTQYLHNIPPGTEIFFKYKSDARKYSRFTGQNRTGVDPKNQTVYPNANFVARDFGLRPGYGHRFAVAGRLDALGNSQNDTIVFGFEDGGDTIIPGHDSLVVSDFDFNDVIFRVTGLDLNVEPIPDSLVVVKNGSIRANGADTALAGDFVHYKAEVWSDSAGIQVRSPQFDSLVRWTCSGNAVLNDSLIKIPGRKDSVVFAARTAFEKFTVAASFPNVAKGDTLRVNKTIYVDPGKPYVVSIESRADTASPGFRLHQMVQDTLEQIPSNDTSRSLYAFFRDSLGNFAGFPASVGWDTSSHSSRPNMKAGVAKVVSGNVAKGEGIVKKVSGSGSILVIASAATGADTLRDTVTVNVVAADYKDLRFCVFVNNAPVPVSACKLTMDQCTSFVAMGQRVDNNVWERVKTQWQSSPWNFSRTIPGDSVGFCPSDTGSGTVSIIYQGTLKKSLPLTVVPGAPVSVLCYTEKGTAFSSDTTVLAGSPLALFARVFDAHNYPIKTLSQSGFSWTLSDDSASVASGDSAGHLDKYSGSSTTFFPQRARRKVSVRVAFQNLSDTLAISVLPGKPYGLHIETSADWQRSPYGPNEIDTLEIPDDRVSEEAWALVRDSLGNFVDTARSLQWVCPDSIVSISRGAFPGEGIIQKNLAVSQGTCRIVVRDTVGKLVPDTAYVKLLPYHYTAVRIVAGNAAIDSITMSTNDDTILGAQGLRSDSKDWVSISAHWKTSDSLIKTPDNSAMYKFSPIRPGKGTVTALFAGKDTLADTVKTIITVGDPVHAEFSMLTVDENCIAGQKLKAVVRIYNKDGLVPGDYCYGKGTSLPPVAYIDSLGYGNGKFIPKVLCASGQADISLPSPISGGLSQCFHNGSDTIELVLYYAPFAKDSLHSIVVKLGSISAIAAPFSLKPASLATIRIAHSNYCCRDTLVLRYPKESALVYSVGYDAYGNVRGEEKCSWKTTGTLHPVANYAPVSRIIYGADSQLVKYDEEGAIVAISAADTAVKGSLHTLIVGPQAMVVSVVTKDDDGDGKLERILVGFSKAVYKRDSFLSSRFGVSFEGTVLPVDSVSVSPDSETVELYLKKQADSTLQTDWTPEVTLDNKGFALGGAVDSFTQTATDGAGPVILSVVKDIRGGDHREDIVTVTFSEPITDKSGNSVPYFIMPEKLFLVWIKTQSGTFENLTMLDGINSLNAPTELSRASFKTSNGKELISSHYLSFRADSLSFQVFDKAQNSPNLNNRKVKIFLKGSPESKLIVAPNPSMATSAHEQPGEFHLSHNPSALQWVQSDHAGFIIKFQMLLPKGSDVQVGGRLKIYDAVGNTVNADPVTDYQWKNLIKGGRVVNNENYDNIMPSSWSSDGTVYDYTVYWNGYTKSKRMAAPGIYQALLTLIINTDGHKESKLLTATIGITR